MRSHLPFSSLCAALLFCVAAAHATSTSVLPDGTIVQYGHKNDVPYLAQWTDGAWAPVAVAAELVPAKGEFESVGADAQGNLYVSYTDETNEKKKTSGLLARVGGSWSRLGTFPKGSTPSSFIAALAPTDVYLDAWLTEERRPLLLHWDGTAYTTVPLPEGTEDLNGLRLHEGGLVLLAYGRGPSGTYRDGSSAYRRAGTAWERMGEPAAGSTDLLLTTADGMLWRLGRVAERWNGTRWDTPFTFENSSLDGYRIRDACPSATGEWYLVLMDKDSKSRLACWPGRGELLWLKGSPETAKFQYGVYDLFVDGQGVLHANSNERYTFADFDFAADGYPTRDDKAREVFDLFNAQMNAHNAASDPFLKAHSNFNTSQSATDFQLLTKATNEGQAWFRTAIEQLEALGLPPKRNRLFDAQLAAMKAGKDQQHYMYLVAEAMHKGTDYMEHSKNLMDANRRQVSAIEAMELATKGYATRNGIY